MPGLTSVDEAKDAIWNALSPLSPETVPLDAASGRVLAGPVIAGMSQPPFNASAMDGYAVRIEDVRKAGAQLRVIGVSSAGERFTGALRAGEAVRIFTGAPVPPGADHILIQEDTARDGDVVRVTAEQKSAANIRPLGVDFHKGETLIAAGARIEGAALALAAAAGAARLSVTRRPRIALIANGDELVMPGETPGPDQIVCSIPFGLAPMIEKWGAQADFLGVARDDMASITAFARKAMDYDVIVPIGGASVGERDFMRAAFGDLGYAPVFEKVAVRPGKPTWFGFAGRAAVLGLPGNPASALVTATLFLRLAIGRLLGRVQSEADPILHARAASALKENGARETWLRAEVIQREDGSLAAAPFGDQDSSLISVMARANALIRRAANAPAEPAGAAISYTPL
ncbi:MAG: molybdopterin molybdotransferase MoeA [Parvularculaceae bacterium]